MKLRVHLLSGVYRDIEADGWSTKEGFLIFARGPERVLTTIAANTLAIEPAPPETSRDVGEGDLFGTLARVR